ncbi:hypothetical protein Ahy_B09g096340 isoform J [Arachis hypogaea]|uniref:Uncharacterized protein n=1 Tax=Arachis hypogaea TaxID=3818 RepID=A0A444XK09_ARAHY|nr:hypothetical protein Ahy_B09g096340 isoform J [Arachis hypogaea]
MPPSCFASHRRRTHKAAAVGG